MLNCARFGIARMMGRFAGRAFALVHRGIPNRKAFASEKDIWARVLSNRLLHNGWGTPRRPPTSLVVKPTLLPP